MTIPDSIDVSFHWKYKANNTENCSHFGALNSVIYGTNLLNYMYSQIQLCQKLKGNGNWFDIVTVCYIGTFI